MKKPSMIIFDYGGTLVKETPFNGIDGTKAMFHYATSEYGIDTMKHLNSVIDDCFQRVQKVVKQTNYEYPYLAVQRYACDYVGINFTKSDIEMEKVYWDHASRANIAEGAQELLDYLVYNHIRIGVISNIAFSGENLKKRLEELFPDITFEFIIASSNYIFRKPDTELFQLAVNQAGNIDTEDIWYCGDQYEVDIKGAMNIGIRPIWLNSLEVDTIKTDERIISIHNLRELIYYINTGH